MRVFDWRAKTIAVCAPFCVAFQKCCLPTTPWEFPNKAKHVRHAICQVLNHGDEPSDCESSCPCYCSQIEGLGLHIVNITRYVIRITKHLYNWVEIIEIESNRKAHVNSPWVDRGDSCILCFTVSLLLCLDSQSVILLLWEMLLMGLAVLMTSLLELLAVIWWFIMATAV